MHLLTALVFAVALWFTDANLSRTILFIRTSRREDGQAAMTLSWVTALAWGLFYYLTH